ncbi:invasion associated locus B family protein [Terasakiella sp. SH-1]|uniref:invasion associated locus B family protein n=1 Tax=Terasakiella sp. SH-1 TaxID=2560057 RepID=UPI001432257A|nr:invasion associated locus B family protein [Terasakiella sp. SH-1]
MTYILTFITALVLSSGAGAAGFEFLGPHGDWDVFADKKKKANVCYIASVPTKASHKKKRSEIYVLVTLRRNEGFKDVVSFHQGYPLKKKKDLRVSVGKRSFKLFGSGETGWTYEAKDDMALVKMMRAGSTMTVKGVSTRGTNTTDTYSLKGISAAYKAMRKACSK